MSLTRFLFVLGLSGAVAACGVAGSSGTASAPRASEAVPEVFEGPVTRAICGPGSRPETGLQGQVPAEDRASGRAADGYTCNLEVVGHIGGVNPTWQQAWYEDCAYFDQDFPIGGGLPPNVQGRVQNTELNPGVVAVDARDPANPVITDHLLTPAMLDPHESLNVNQKRALLAGVAAFDVVGNGPAFFDVYDVSGDCAHPVKRASLPVDLQLGHEGNWAPDGRTYYATQFAPGILNPIDASDASFPKPITTLPFPGTIHGLDVSEDGNRLYLARSSLQTDGSNGMDILDVSSVNVRAAVPRIGTVGSVTWADGSTAQHSIPIRIKGKPYVVFVDEGGLGMARIIDVSDETHPVVIAKLKDEIDMPDADVARGADGGSSGFTYQGHYCGVDSRAEATVLGCSYFWQGIRIFDIRDPYHPKEIAYFNPWGADGSYASARVRFIPERAEVWATDQANGFYILRFTNGVWPFK